MSEKIRASRSKHEQHTISDAIEKLTSLDILEVEKVLVLLAFAGKKPAGEISFPDRPEFQNRIDSFRSILRQIGLKFDEDHRTSSGRPRVHFDIARSIETLEQMRELEMRRASMSREQWHREHGKLYGFPDTAVKAFTNHEELLDELPDEVRDTAVGRFKDRAVAMRLSKAHWRSELKTLEQWMHAAHEVAPKYIEYLVSDAWQPEGGGGH